MAEAKKVLDTVAKKYGHEFEYETLLMGGCSIDAYGEPLTEESLEKAKASDAVLLGAVGGNVGNSRWYQVAPNLRPEAGLLKIRKRFWSVCKYPSGKAVFTIKRCLSIKARDYR